MQGINLLKKHGVEWNAMAVVNDFNADYPLEFYKFFKEIGSHYIQFAPIVERIMPHQDGRHLASLTDKEKATELADFSVSPEQWGNFLCTLFDEWVKQDVVLTISSSSTPPCQLGGRTAGRMFYGKDLRTCRCNGIQR